MAQHDKKMGAFLREVSNWDWEQFCRAEHDDQYTSNEAIIFGLIRSCAMQKMEAIRMSLNRLDGKLKTPVILETPKIFYLFPNATITESERKGEVGNLVGIEVMEERNALTGELIPARDLDAEPEVTEEDLPSLSLRDTLDKMSDYPRELPIALIAKAEEVQQCLNAGAPMPAEVPKVKSVVAAHLLTMAANRNLAALTEVFDQIDGKLAETIQLIGEDIYITNYSNIAPPGATVNANGVLQIEAEAAQLMWADKLKAMR